MGTEFLLGSEEVVKGQQEEDDDEDVSTAAHPALFNELVIENVLKFLPTNDLLRVSLVCRRWNGLAWKYLRLTGQVMMALDLEQLSPRDIQDLTALLQSSTSVPYGGIFLNLQKSHKDHSSHFLNHTNWPEFVDLLFEKLGKFKSLSVHLGYWNEFSIQFLLDSILTRCQEHIQFLKLDGYLGLLDDLYKTSTFSFEFPKLTQFQFDSWERRRPTLLDGVDYYKSPDLEFSKSVISASPKLKRVQGYVDSDWLADDLQILRGSRNLLTELHLELSSVDSVQRAKEILICSQQQRSVVDLKKIFVTRFNDATRRWNLESREILSQILSNWKETLEVFEIAHEILLQLTKDKGLPCMRGLKKLEIIVPARKKANKLLKGIDLPKNFPNLTEVSVDLTALPSSASSPLLLLDTDVVGLGKTVPSTSVRVVEIREDKNNRSSSVGPELVFRLGTLFPNVRNFRVDNPHYLLEDYLKVLRTVWNDGLECVTVSKILVFSSVKPLTNVLAHFKRKPNFKLLRLEVLAQKKGKKKLVPNPGQVMFPEDFAGADVFGQIEGLTIELYTAAYGTHVNPEHCFTLSHLEPYAKIVDYCCKLNQ